jgi:hypothetical protein
MSWVIAHQEWQERFCAGKTAVFLKTGTLVRFTFLELFLRIYRLKKKYEKFIALPNAFVPRVRRSAGAALERGLASRLGRRPSLGRRRLVPARVVR